MSDVRVLIDTLRLASPQNVESLRNAWAQADTGALISLAEYEGATLWLQRRIAALGVHLDDTARTRLKTTTRRSLAHSIRVDAETFACLGKLDAVGIAAVPLKGAAVRRLALRIPYVDARPVTDVDLLVQEKDAQRGWDMLVAEGYVPVKPTGPPDGHHLASLAGPFGVTVELHLSTVAAVPAAEAWRRATCDGAVADYDGTLRGVPGDTELLWHVMSHALVTSTELAYDALRLRYWLDAAAILASGMEIDWARLRPRLALPETPNPTLARAWFQTAAYLAGVEMPAGALGGAEKRLDLERLLSWRLRVLPTFSPSHRWTSKLFEEAARGEAGMPLHPGATDDTLAAHIRHALVSQAARTWWIIRR